MICGMQPTRPPTIAPLRPLTHEECELYFGRFACRSEPTPQNPEHFVVTDDWRRKNLITFALPKQLAALPGGDKATFHRMVRPRFEELVAAWEEEGLLGDILSWNGSYASRFVRGSKASVSAHAYGAAFDINAPYNRLKQPPAPLGTKGSVLRLVPLAEQFGWYWGGHMRRPDGMHFELARF